MCVCVFLGAGIYVFRCMFTVNLVLGSNHALLRGKVGQGVMK